MVHLSVPEVCFQNLKLLGFGAVADGQTVGAQLHASMFDSANKRAMQVGTYSLLPATLLEASSRTSTRTLFVGNLLHLLHTHHMYQVCTTEPPWNQSPSLHPNYFLSLPSHEGGDEVSLRLPRRGACPRDLPVLLAHS